MQRTENRFPFIFKTDNILNYLPTQNQRTNERTRESHLRDRRNRKRRKKMKPKRNAIIFTFLNDKIMGGMRIFAAFVTHRDLLDFH